MLAHWNIKLATKAGAINRTLTATVLAVVMHITGALGMLFWRRDWFLMLTPFNLLVMFFLLIWTLPEKKPSVYWFFAGAFLIGIGSEMIGVQTGLLFGNYQYGNVLGFRINGVPLLIGIYWFIIVYASGMLANRLRKIITPAFGERRHIAFIKWLGSTVIIDGAILATIFDFIMEPAAMKLGFWSWLNGQVPVMNYISWFLVSIVILFLFRKTSLRHHQFAINLLIIQALFFLILR